MKDLTRQVALLCPTCGNDQFEYSDDEEDESDDSSIIRCSDCGFECTKTEIIEMNQELINNNIEEVQEELMKELMKAFR